jgi:N-acyl-D-aspartate/D-glutamate deacylase
MGIFDQLPSWRRVMDAPLADLPAVFRDPEFRAAFRQDVTGDYEGFRLFKGDWDEVKVLLVGDAKLTSRIGRSVAELAAERGADPFDALLDDGYLIGLSDAGAHLTLLADHAYATYFLGTWVRERGLMPLEDAVRKLTQVPAELFGIPRRGVLADGNFADVVLFDPTRIAARETQLVHDLPGGGPRLVTEADGIEAVLVNGAVTVERGELTGARPGSVLRGA